MGTKPPDVSFWGDILDPDYNMGLEASTVWEGNFLKEATAILLDMQG